MLPPWCDPVASGAAGEETRFGHLLHNLKWLAAGTATPQLSSWPVDWCFASCASPGVDNYGMTLGPISAQQVAKNPLAHLYFPGSKPFFRFNSGSKEGANDGPAGAGTLLTSNATGSQIYAWYTQKLKSLGWTFVTDNGCRDIEASCPQYGHDGHGNREVFYLAVTNPALVVDAFGTRAPAACTVYDMAYEVFPPGGTRVYQKHLVWNGGDSCWWTGTKWSVPLGTRGFRTGAP